MSHPQDFGKALDAHIQHGPLRALDSIDELPPLAPCPWCGRKFVGDLDGWNDHMREECWAERLRLALRVVLHDLDAMQAGMEPTEMALRATWAREKLRQAIKETFG